MMFWKNLPCEVEGLSAVGQMNFVTDSAPPNPSNLKYGFFFFFF